MRGVSIMGKIIDWFKTKLEGGVSLYEADTDDGSTCSMKVKTVGNKTKEIFDKVGSNDCLEDLKKKILKVES